MGTRTLSGRILRWGNSYGIRLRKADLERTGLRAGDEATVHIEAGPETIDLSGLPRFRGGASDVSEQHDRYLGEARSAALSSRARARRSDPKGKSR